MSSSKETRRSLRNGVTILTGGGLVVIDPAVVDVGAVACGEGTGLVREAAGVTAETGLRVGAGRMVSVTGFVTGARSGRGPFSGADGMIFLAVASGMTAAGMTSSRMGEASLAGCTMGDGALGDGALVAAGFLLNKDSPEEGGSAEESLFDSMLGATFSVSSSIGYRCVRMDDSMHLIVQYLICHRT